MNTLADFLFHHYDEIKGKRIVLTNDAAITFNNLAESQKYVIENNMIIGKQQGKNNETRTVVIKYYLPMVTQGGKLNNNFYDYIEIAHYQIGFEKREIEMKSFKIHGLSYPVKEQGVSTGNANDEIIIDSDMIKNNTLEKSRSK